MHDCDNPPCVNPAHLWLGTAADNTADMLAKMRHRRWEAHPASKLSNAEVRAIRLLKAQGVRNATIAHQFGVTPTNIGYIVNNRSWRFL